MHPLVIYFVYVSHFPLLSLCTPVYIRCRHTVRNECQQLEQLLQSVEQANSAVCKVLSSQIAG